MEGAWKLGVAHPQTFLKELTLDSRVMSKNQFSLQLSSVAVEDPAMCAIHSEGGSASPDPKIPLQHVRVGLGCGEHSGAPISGLLWGQVQREAGLGLFSQPGFSSPYPEASS